MATFSLTNFAVIDGQFILIYDNNGVIRHSIIPHESDFYTRGINCIVETHGNNSQTNNNSAFNVDKYLILDFSSESEAAQATEKLFNLKTSIRYYVNWDNINGTPNTLYNYGIKDAYTKVETDNIVSGITVDLSGYYTSAQTNANFLSANTSFYSIESTNANFLSANTSFYTKVETDNIVSGITVDLSGYYTSAQTNANFYTKIETTESVVGMTARKYLSGNTVKSNMDIIENFIKQPVIHDITLIGSGTTSNNLSVVDVVIIPMVKLNGSLLSTNLNILESYLVSQIVDSTSSGIINLTANTIRILSTTLTSAHTLTITPVAPISYAISQACEIYFSVGSSTPSVTISAPSGTTFTNWTTLPSNWVINTKYKFMFMWISSTRCDTEWKKV